MKKVLLMTTALVAAFSVAELQAKVIDTLPTESSADFNVFVEDYTGEKSADSLNPSYLTDDEVTIQKVYLQTLYGTPENPLGVDVGDKQVDGHANTKKAYGFRWCKI